MAEPEQIVPKTDADVDEIVRSWLEWATAQKVPMIEAEVRRNVEDCRRLKIAPLRPFTDEEMRNRW